MPASSLEEGLAALREEELAAARPCIAWLHSVKKGCPRARLRSWSRPSSWTHAKEAVREVICSLGHDEGEAAPGLDILWVCLVFVGFLFILLGLVGWYLSESCNLYPSMPTLGINYCGDDEFHHSRYLILS
ncbi:hypothetical protein Dimus_034367 [Dionaea muscipula]